MVSPCFSANQYPHIYTVEWRLSTSSGLYVNLSHPIASCYLSMDENLNHFHIYLLIRLLFLTALVVWYVEVHHAVSKLGSGPVVGVGMASSCGAGGTMYHCCSVCNAVLDISHLIISIKSHWQPSV